MKHKKNGLPRGPQIKPGGGTPAKLPAPVRVATLAQLEAVFADGFECRFVKEGRVILLTGRRLTPVESRRIKELMEDVLPPELPGEDLPGGEKGPPRYDFKNEQWRKTVEDRKRQARAVCLFLSYPKFFGEAAWPAERFVAEVTQRIEHSQVPEAALEMMFRAAIQDPISMAEAASFT